MGTRSAPARRRGPARPSTHLAGAAVGLVPAALLALALPVWSMVGCDRSDVASSSAPSSAHVSPATAASDAADARAAASPHAVPATSPTTTATRPAAAQMLVDRRLVEFPPARLVLRPKGGQVYALLYSDDPPEALDEDYTGNSFYFEMTVADVPEPERLASAQWIFKAPTSERVDTPNGIFLNGGRQHLQPSDVLIEFDRSSVPAKVWVNGHFMLFDSSADLTVPGQLIPVRAELDADLVAKGGGR